MQSRNFRYKILSIAASIFLALTFIAYGYALCAGVPYVAEKVAYATVSEGNSPFSKESLVKTALAVREYSFGNHDKNALLSEIVNINNKANTPYANGTVETIVSAPEAFTITNEQIAHLDDVYNVSSRIVMPIISLAAISIFLLMTGFRMFGTKLIECAFKWSGVITLIFMAVISLFAIFSFNSFFSVFHSVFFEAGSWQFSANSLLINALPESFWFMIGCVWAAITCLLAACSLACAIIYALKNQASS